MTGIRIAELVMCSVALVAFGWGMTCFFGRSSRPRPLTRAVAALGGLFAAWHLWAIWKSDPNVWQATIAMVLYTLALALFLWAIRTSCRRSLMAIFDNGSPRHLEVDGPFRYLRHPIYVAYMTFWWAGAMASRSWIAAASALVMSWLYVRAARSEEAAFRRSSLVEEHTKYCQRTPFMLPGTKP